MLPQELVDAITPAFALKVTRLRIPSIWAFI